MNANEPQYLPTSIDCPSDLPDDARKDWDRVAAQLIATGHVTTVDRAVLAGYCLKYAQWQALEAEAARHPFVVKTPKGYPMPNPVLGMANKVFGLMLKAAAELGITPSSRSRVHAQEPAKPISKWAGALS
jgi:P27 family predicted phage terminase small subunit